MNPYRAIFQALNDAERRIEYLVTHMYGVFYRSVLPNRSYLLWCKQHTPSQRLDWLAAAREFVMVTKRKKASH